MRTPVRPPQKRSIQKPLLIASSALFVASMAFVFVAERTDRLPDEWQTAYNDYADVVDSSYADDSASSTPEYLQPATSTPPAPDNSTPPTSTPSYPPPQPASSTPPDTGTKDAKKPKKINVLLSGYSIPNSSKTYQELLVDNSTSTNSNATSAPSFSFTLTNVVADTNLQSVKFELTQTKKGVGNTKDFLTNTGACLTTWTLHNAADNSIIDFNGSGGAPGWAGVGLWTGFISQGSDAQGKGYGALSLQLTKPYPLKKGKNNFILRARTKTNSAANDYAAHGCTFNMLLKPENITIVNGGTSFVTQGKPMEMKGKTVWSVTPHVSWTQDTPAGPQMIGVDTLIAKVKIDLLPGTFSQPVTINSLPIEFKLKRAKANSPVNVKFTTYKDNLSDQNIIATTGLYKNAGNDKVALYSNPIPVANAPILPSGYNKTFFVTMDTSKLKPGDALCVSISPKMVWGFSTGEGAFSFPAIAKNGNLANAKKCLVF